jgi:hypothetical protein
MLKISQSWFNLADKTTRFESTSKSRIGAWHMEHPKAFRFNRGRLNHL